ncbi:phosphotransferase family protein [Streptacidiphilus sp. EB103A]|uniref:phosphotransferase family protein n=1 Tax=Streptacidiphilus sp. EB103A TaxID=3156275 RepID=UPI00351947D6
MADDAGTILGPGALDVLTRRALGGEIVVDQRRLSGGFSSDNVLLRTDRGRSFVLRRYPRRNTAAVEAALLDLVQDRVPVPKVVYVDESGELLNEPFMLTRFVSGVALTAVFSGAADQDGPQLADAVAEALASIHAVRFGQPGFFADGALRPDAPPPEHHDDLPAFVEACLTRAHADGALSVDARRALVQIAARSASLVAATAGADQLVHSDFNAKNLLMRPGDNGAWRVSAVLDWEYAFSGSGLFDLGNILRFPKELCPGFADRFPRAYTGAGGELPAHWREISKALDLFALAELLTRSPDHPLFAKAVAVVWELVAQHRDW